MTNIKKLKSDSSNWDVWKSTIILILQHHKLLDYIEGSFPKPTPNYPPNTPSPAPPGTSPTNAAAIQDWTDKNLEAQIQIYMTLEHDVVTLVTQKKVAANIWSTLILKFKGKGLTALSMLTTQLWTYHMLPDRDIMTQIQEIISVTLKINSLGFPIPDEFQITAILKALPSQWNTISTILLNQSNVTL